jgi:hypothetical protein
MAHNLVNRYKQLLATVPTGKFYESSGQVLPYRNRPYVLNYAVGAPHTRFGVFLNEVFYTEVITDANGVATVSVQFNKGFNELKLVNSQTQAVTVSYITTRDYATWLAAIAELIESIDESTEQVLDDSRLATASADAIDAVFGKLVDSGNAFNYSLETYRIILQELRQAYRRYGATRRGLEDVVRAFTGVSPLSYSMQDGPHWVLGRDLIYPNIDTAKRTVYTTSALTNINSTGANVQITGIDSDVAPGSSHILVCDGTVSPKTLRWNAGPDVQITHDGTYYLPGVNTVQDLYSVRAPATGWNISNINNKLIMSIGNRPPIEITLTSGTRTAAQIAAEINAALFSHPSYGNGGPTFNNTASSYNPYGHGGQMLRIRSNASLGPIRLYTTGVEGYTSTTSSASQVLFNLPYVRAELDVGHAAGVPVITILTPPNVLSKWPKYASEDEPIWITIHNIVYDPIIQASSNSHVPFPVETLKVVWIDSQFYPGKTLLFLEPGVVTQYDHYEGQMVYLAGTDKWESKVYNNTAGIIVKVQNYNLLPGSIQSDTITIEGTGLPDTWRVSDPVNMVPKPNFASLFNSDRDLATNITISQPNANVLFIKVPDEILKYKGFPVNIYIWAEQSVSYAPPYPDISAISIKWDSGPYVSVPFTKVDQEQAPAENRPDSYMSQVVVPSTATQCEIKVEFSNQGVIIIHKVRVMPSMQFGLFLGSGTIPRSAHQAKSGEFMFIWSPEALTTAESKKLGTTNPSFNYGSHIDHILPDFVHVSRFDVSSYDPGPPVVATNVRGVFTDADFTAGTATNLELVVNTPARFSYMKPTTVSEVTQKVYFTTTPPYVATLDIAASQNMANAVLLEGGVPVTQDQWQFNSPTQVELLYTPNTTVEYEIRYEALVQFESGIVDLLPGYADYGWWADYHVFQRDIAEIAEFNVSTGVQFDADGTATLPDAAVMDKTRARLTQDFGLGNVNAIPATRWDFVNNATIRIDQQLFNPDAVYEFKYVATTINSRPLSKIKFEYRTASTPGGLSAATYTQVERNSPVTGLNRYVQFRLSVTGIVDVRDVRVMSLCMKGLPLFNSSSIPVLK